MQRNRLCSAKQDALNQVEVETFDLVKVLQEVNLNDNQRNYEKVRSMTYWLLVKNGVPL